MAINLTKRAENRYRPFKMTVGLGWNPNEGTGYDFDLDVSAIMIDANRLCTRG
jgi:tellurium resistance protein TerD